MGQPFFQKYRNRRVIALIDSLSPMLGDLYFTTTIDYTVRRRLLL